MDLAQSRALRDRRQLETIILHLLDAIRCHTDGGDLLFELNDAKHKSSRPNSLSGGTPNTSPQHSPDPSPTDDIPPMKR